MEVSGQLQAPATLPPGKELLVPIGYEAGWAPEPVWMPGWGEKFPVPSGSRTPDIPARSPALYHWAISAPFVPLKQTLFLWTAKLGKNFGCSISVMEFGQYTSWQMSPCELEHFHGGESNRWTKFLALFYPQLHITALIFPYNKLGWLLGLVEYTVF
jgi:hypothetical protein